MRDCVLSIGASFHGKNGRWRGALQTGVRGCEVLLDRLEVVCPVTEAGRLCVCGTPHRAWCADGIFGKSSSVRSSSHEHLHPRTAHVLESSIVDLPQWFVGDKGPGASLAQYSTMLRLHSRTQCAGTLRRADAAHWTSSSGKGEGTGVFQAPTTNYRWRRHSVNNCTPTSHIRRVCIDEAWRSACEKTMPSCWSSGLWTLVDDGLSRFGRNQSGRF